MTGGNFWQGAATGFIVSALNHAAHRIQKKYNVAVMMDNEGANGAGHEGIALEKPNGKYHYFSKNDAEHWIVGEPGVSAREVNSLEHANDVYKEASGGKSYDRVAVFKATRSQIKRGISFAQKTVGSYYSLIGNSCTTLVTQTMAVTFGTSWKIMFEGSIPKLNFQTRKSTYYNNYRGTINYGSLLLINQLRYLD